MKKKTWYDTGFEDGLGGYADPPMYAGHRGYENYMAGFYDGERQAERDAARSADKIDGYDRDDLGESPDY